MIVISNKTPILKTSIPFVSGMDTYTKPSRSQNEAEKRTFVYSYFI